MTTEVKRLIRVRTEKGATFKRDGFGKKRQLSDSWRKPRGQHNKQREQKKAKGALPKPGFGSPVAVRGMHPSGFFEVLIFSEKELVGLDPKTQAVRIAATVGDRKRGGLQEKAIAAGLKVLNARVAKAEAKAQKVKAAPKDESKAKKEKKPAPSKVPVKPVKKETKKGKPALIAEEKKAAVKTTKKSVKPKAEKSEKSPEKPETKTPPKTAKKSAKPKTESSKNAVKAKSTAATKPKAKKKTESGVKKNE